EELAAYFEVVAAAPPVLEVAERSEDLVPGDVAEPAVPIPAAHDVRADVLIRRSLRVTVVRPQVMELAPMHLEEHLVADNVVPAGLVGMCPVGLVPCRIGAVVNRRRRTDEERVEAVGLLLLPPLRERDDLVVRVQRVGAFARDVLQVRLERLDGEIRQQALRILIAPRALPPTPLLPAIT